MLQRVPVLESKLPAVTRYRVIRRLPELEATVLELTLETGRTHQISVHMVVAQYFKGIAVILWNPQA